MMDMKKFVTDVLLVASLTLTWTVFALDRVAIIPAHPDDLISCLGFAHLAKGVFELHVIDFTHGERGCGEIRTLQKDRFGVV